MVWHFIGVYIINRTLHDRLEIRNFSSRVEKYFTRSLRSLVKYLVNKPLQAAGMSADNVRG